MRIRIDNRSSGGGGGGGGNYETVYTDATVSPLVAFWTVVDGQATQVGLEAGVTTGTTAITFGAGTDFDGVFDFTPIGATLATLQATTCTFDSFVSGALTNLSLFSLLGCTFSGSLDLSGCLNALVVNLDQCTVPTISLPTSLYQFSASGGTYGTIPFAGCVNVVAISLNSSATPAQTLTGITGLGDCSSLANLTIYKCDLVTIDFGGCQGPLTAALDDLQSLTTLDASGCTNMVSLSVGGFWGTPLLSSVDISGADSLSYLALVSASLVTITFTALPVALDVQIPNSALNVASVNAILVALDANGLSNGNVYLAGGTSAAPTGAGATAATNLLGKGWTVTTN